MGDMLMLNYINASTAAEQIGCSIATVSRWADRMGFDRKYGNALALTKKEVEAIRKQWRKKRGNPDFVSKSSSN